MDWEGEECIQDDGALHVQNETSATGSAFAISYHADIFEITLETLPVFTVVEQYVHTSDALVITAD